MIPPPWLRAIRTKSKLNSLKYSFCHFGQIAQSFSSYLTTKLDTRIYLASPRQQLPVLVKLEGICLEVGAFNDSDTIVLLRFSQSLLDSPVVLDVN